jgi:F-type H+-transporting ATPase subunit delta
MTTQAPRVFAREYARVLYTLAVDERGAVQEFFRALHGAAALVPHLTRFLDHPVITNAEKLKLLKSIETRNWSPVVERVIADVVKRRMTYIFADIADEMRRLSDEADSVHPVVVTSASPLSAQQQRALIERLQAYFSGKVKAAFAVDATLLAGFSLRSGDTVLDNSLKTDLEHIRRRLTAVSST